MRWLKAFISDVKAEVFDVKPAALVGSIIQAIALYYLGVAAKCGCDRFLPGSWCSIKYASEIANAVPALVLGLLAAVIIVMLVTVVLASKIAVISLPILLLFGGLGFAIYLAITSIPPWNYFLGIAVAVGVVFAYGLFVKWITGGNWGDRGGRSDPRAM